MIDKERIKSEAQNFFEWPSEDKTYVTTVSMLIFAETIAEMARTETRQHFINNAKPLLLLQQAFDALESTADSDIDHFEDEEEEAEAVPTQYACRKIIEAMDLLRAENRERLLGA